MNSFIRFFMVISLLAAGSAFADSASNSIQPQSGDKTGNSRSVVFLERDDSGVADNARESADSAPLLDPVLPPSNRSFELSRGLAYGMSAEEETGEVEAVSADKKKVLPGPALLMSAILPGTGQLYAGMRMESGWFQYFKSAVFFTAEVGLWYGAISYSLREDHLTDKAYNFADEYWYENVYRKFEYDMAINTTGNSNVFGSVDEQTGGVTPYPMSDWEALSWEDKIEGGYLPAYFTHELPSQAVRDANQGERQQYYEMIGKYLYQFGIGWYGEWPANYQNTDLTGYNWETNNDSYNYYAMKYIDQRAEFNHMGDVAGTYFMVIMANHVVAALDAGFTVHLRNRQEARAEMSARMQNINGLPVAMGGLNLTFGTASR